MVWCNWCVKGASCPSRRDGPTVCMDFEARPGVVPVHGLEDLPPAPETELPDDQ